MENIELNVKGMMCSGCENRIKNAISMIDGVTEVKASHDTGKVIVSVNKAISKDEIAEAIIDIGYEVC